MRVTFDRGVLRMHNGQLEYQLNSKGSHAGNRTRAMVVKTPDPHD